MDAPPLYATKAEWRDWARKTAETVQWKPISAAVVQALRTWQPLLSADRILLFMPMANEVDLMALRDDDTMENRYLTTRTPDRGSDLTIHELDGPLEVHRFGFVQPHAGARQYPVADVSVLLVPGLAFDIHGNRLGHGAGYYDRLLSGVRRGAFTVGVTAVDLVVDELPTEPHDQPVRFLATEEGVIETAHP